MSRYLLNGGLNYDPGDGKSTKKLRRRARRVAREHHFNPYHYKCGGRFGCVPVQKFGSLIDFSGAVDDVVKWYSNWQFENETADRNAVRAAIKEYVGSYTQHKSLWGCAMSMFEGYLSVKGIIEAAGTSEVKIAGKLYMAASCGASVLSS